MTYCLPLAPRLKLSPEIKDQKMKENFFSTDFVHTGLKL